MSKARRIDYHPDEFIAGVAGQMDPEDVGVYWMVCSLQYSKGAPIDDDAVWISRMFKTAHWRSIRAILDRLIASGKVMQEGGKIWVKRAAEELQTTGQRIDKARANGSHGGRPSRKINDITKADGLISEKLTTNHQPPTIDIPEGISPVSPSSLDTAFEEWWLAYPSGRKQSKPKCREKYLRVVKSGQASPAELLAGAGRYAAAGYGNSQFVKGPLPWLNGSHWTDEDIPPPGDRVAKVCQVSRENPHSIVKATERLQASLRGEECPA